MKIRKFNESVYILDSEYIKDCFIDFIDNNLFTIDFKNYIHQNRLIIKIKRNGKIYDDKVRLINHLYLNIEKV